MKLSDDIECMKELRDSSMGADNTSTLSELKDTKRIEEEWKMREHDVIYGRSMDYEPWCICAMTIIKRRLSELIVNVNNLTKAADMHMNDIMCISDSTTKENYRQIINLLSMTWSDFKDGPFLPEEDIKWSPETMCGYTLQRKFEFILWLITSNTINIRMRIKMYTDVLINMRRQITTHEIEDTESGTQETGHVTERTFRIKNKCKEMKTHKRKNNGSRSRHLKFIEESESCGMGGIKQETKVMCKRNSAKKKERRG